METGSSHFYDRWVGESGLSNEPDVSPEAQIDCSNCHMVRPRGLTRDLGPFRPDLKCCTFDPFLPSFTLGSPDFKARVLEKALADYVARRRLTPLGALPKISGSLNMPKTNSICDAGRNPKEACAFLSKTENATCTIHSFRPSPCVGYTCRSSIGSEGFKIREQWEAGLNSFEWTLSHLTAFELGYTFDDIDVEFSSVALAMGFYEKAFVTALRISL